MCNNQIKSEEKTTKWVTANFSSVKELHNTEISVFFESTYAIYVEYCGSASTSAWLSGLPFPLHPLNPSTHSPTFLCSTKGPIAFPLYTPCTLYLHTCISSVRTWASFTSYICLRCSSLLSCNCSNYWCWSRLHKNSPHNSTVHTARLGFITSKGSARYFSMSIDL